MRCLPAILPVPSLPVTAASPRAATIGRHAAALLALTKPRLAFFSVLTAMAAYAVAATHPAPLHVVFTLLGTALAAGGALSLNQWWEREPDAQMRRTRSRPLPAQTLTPTIALAWSLSLSLGGVGLLAVAINLPSAALAAATIVIYGLIYTPLKRRTRWATEIGSISGALPPLLGAAAAGDVWNPAGVTLAGILLLWQMPHFFAIGWMHRADYRLAGFPLLPAIDPTGRRTAAWSFSYTALLLIVSLIPAATGHAGAIFTVVALLGGLALLHRAALFLRAQPDHDRAARRLFLGSILYLPLIMTALLIDALLR